MIRRATAWGVALSCAALACWLAAFHPLSPALALVGVGLAAALAYARPAHMFVWLLPMLPLAGLMPWSGWLITEEFDLLLLAVAAGGWAQRAHGNVAHPAPLAPRLLPALLLLVLALATGMALHRGVADAGGWAWGWWQGYREPLNSLRLAKPLVGVLLLQPLWRDACDADADVAARRMMWGMTGLLVVVAAVVVLERMAYTGLLNFSTDYRTVGPFWEMHVGGAALDAVLVMALPCAVAGVGAARSTARWAAAAAALVLGAYAALATFSRIVYLALPIALMLYAVLQARQRPAGTGLAANWVGGAAACLAYLVAAAWLFPGSGYRGLLALLGLAALVLPLTESRLRGLPPAALLKALGAGLLGAAAVGLVAVFLPKGAYIAYAGAWLLSALALQRAWRAASPGAAWAAWAGWLAAVAGFVAVGWNWGESKGLSRSLPVAAALLVLFFAIALLPRRGVAATTSTQGAGWRERGQWLGVMAVLSVLVGIFSGGAYMGDRIAGASQDMADRRGHWGRALALLDGPADWAFGKGLGRYWAQQSLSGRPEDQTGDYRWVEGPDGASLVLVSGKHVMGWGQIFRFSQRVPAPIGPGATLRLMLRSEQDVNLHAEICTKHLLYNEGCLIANRHIASSHGAWQVQEIQLTGEITGGGWLWANKGEVFSIGLESLGARVEVDKLSLSDAAGRELLRNGGFDRGLARWYFSSDHHHMPWHLKNLAVHALFEQGILGLAAWSLLFGLAIWRTTLGKARGHVLSPPLAAALVAVLVVGLVDSLLDMPRVAWLMLWLAVMAVGLPAARGRTASAPA